MRTCCLLISLLVQSAVCTWWEDLQRQVSEAVSLAEAARGDAWKFVHPEATRAVSDSGIEGDAEKAQGAVSMLMQRASEAGVDVSKCMQTSRGEMSDAAGRMGILMFDCMTDSVDMMRQAKEATRTVAAARRRASECGGSTLETYDCSAGVWLEAAGALRGNVEGIYGDLQQGPEGVAAELSGALGPCASRSYESEKAAVGKELDAFAACVQTALTQ